MLKYVSLGDSIAYGMSSDPEKGFSDLYSTFLKSKEDHEYTFINTAVPGWKTNDLYRSIVNPGGVNEIALKEANVITISIGANNLLGPILKSFQNANKLIPGKKGMRKKVLFWFMTTVYGRSLLNYMMECGLKDFQQEWPLILSKITEKAPDTKITALKIYSALKSDHPYYELFNPYVVRVNQMIEAQADHFRYHVVDVYSSFKNSSTPPINFDLEQDHLDPHPNNFGHELIFKNLI